MEIGDYEQAKLKKYVTNDFKNADIKKIISILEYYNVFTYFDEVEESLIEYYDIPYGIQDYVDLEALAEDSNYYCLSNGLVLWQSLWIDENNYYEAIDYFKDYDNIDEMIYELDISLA